MGMNDTPSSERLHIGFFGRRNAGKSSVVNAVTNQNMSLVSDKKGTTTDPVEKTMYRFLRKRKFRILLCSTNAICLTIQLTVKSL